MLLGGEIGLDRPQFAEHLRVFSDIFLRLIKVIVAPLIFGHAGDWDRGAWQFAQRWPDRREELDLF